MLFPRMPRYFLFLCLLMVVTAITAAQASAQLSFRPADPLNNVAFDHFYNMDYARSISEFDQVLQKHPDDPFAVNHILTAVLFQELYRMGALNTGDYANDSFVATAHRPADPPGRKGLRGCGAVGSTAASDFRQAELVSQRRT